MKDDLISRSALHSMVCLDSSRGTYGEFTDGSEVSFTANEVHAMINEAPPVDAVEVVRCKDCKYYGLGACLKIYSDGAASVYAWQYRKSDDFCSYGERRADDAD